MTPIDRVKASLLEATAITGLDFRDHPVVVGVSGGPDSLTLLHLLRQLVPPKHLIVAHLDHGLRPNSEAETEIVAAMADDLRFHAERVDVGEIARAGRLSLEEAGRITRYDFLAHVARLESALVIAVGHNADDQVETILMHFLRGSGMSGLRGMQSVSRLPHQPDLWLWRPLLQITRAEIDACCVENDITPLIDTSNSDQSFLRNRLRHDLVPRLEAYNPQIRRRLWETAGILAADDDLLSALTEQSWRDIVLLREEGHVEFHRSSWQQVPLALRRRLLRTAIATVRPDLRDVGYRTLELARQVAESHETSSRVTLPGGIVLLVRYNRLIIANESTDLVEDLPQLPASKPIVLPVPGAVDLENSWRLTAEILDSAESMICLTNDDPWMACIALDKPVTLTIRPRARGERIQPLGMTGTTKIKEIMIDRKIPAQARARWPIISTREHALWIVGHLLDDRAKVLTGSQHIVRLRCRQLEEPEGG